MRKRTIFAVVPAALAALAVAYPAAAQTANPTATTTEAELAALRARVATLESSSNNRLSFNLSNGTSIEFYGYIKGDLFYDSDFNLGSTTFGLKSIGLAGGPAAGNFTTGQAKQSRFGFRISSGELEAKIEGDFFGGAGNHFRLRHAYGQYRGVLVGQTWTNFMPLNSYPGTIDFQGPAGIPFARVAQVRYTYDNSAGLVLSGSLENDIAASSSQPAITAAGSYDFGRGTIRLAGISRNITVTNTSGTFNVNAWGATLGGTAKLWQGGTLLANYTTGDANSDLLVFNFTGNAQVDATGGTRRSNAVTAGISQDLGDTITLAAAIGRTQVGTTLATDTHEVRSMHLTGWYKPAKNVKFGLEFFRGLRTDAVGTVFSANRVQFAGQFSF